MALPSSAHRLSPAPEETAQSGSDRAPGTPRARLFARVKGILTDRSENRLAQLVAGKVFLVRAF